MNLETLEQTNVCTKLFEFCETKHMKVKGHRLYLVDEVFNRWDCLCGLYNFGYIDMIENKYHSNVPKDYLYV